MSNRESQVGKSVINTHLNLQNVVDMKLPENRKLFTDTLCIIEELLTPHCGPYSQYAMIVDQNAVVSGNAKLASPSVFSKDGITLLEKIEFASIIQTYLKNVITYVGREVDRRAKDGTTTAMLVAAAFLKNILLNKDKLEALRLTTVEQGDSYKKFVSIVMEQIQEESFSIEKMMSMYPKMQGEQYWAGIVAFMQSMSSSGGNVQLSKCMRTIFGNIPRQAWEHQTWLSSKIEDEVDYTVEIEKYDFSMEIDFQTQNLYNEVMQTEWIKENVRVLAIPDGMASNDTCTANILEYIKNYPTDKPLCIITSTTVSEIVRAVGDANTKREEPVALATYFTKNKSFTQYAMDIAVLNAIASTKPYIQSERQFPLTDDYTFVVEKIRTYGSTMEFYGVFPHEAGVPTIHPNYVNGCCQFYNDLLEDLQLRSKHADLSHAKDQFIYDTATLAIKNMICIHMPTLKLGGTTHDNVAAHHVVRDVIGATMASINDTFFINGVLSMQRVLDNVKNYIESDDYVTFDYYRQYMLLIYENFKDAIDTVIKILYVKNNTTLEDTIVRSKALGTTEYINAMAQSDVTGDLDMFVEYLELETDDTVEVKYEYPIIQPVSIYHEILNRVGELIIKLTTTDKVIVPGGVYVKGVSDV